MAAAAIGVACGAARRLAGGDEANLGARAFHALSPAGTEKRWYDAGHRLPPEHFADPVEFLHRKIGIAAPVAADRLGPYPPPASGR